MQLLNVGVDGDELDLRDTGVHHPVKRVQSSAADADDTDYGQVRRRLATRRAVDARCRLGQRVLGHGRQVELARRSRDLPDGSPLRRRGRGRDDVLDRLLPGRDVLYRLLVYLLLGSRRLPLLRLLLLLLLCGLGRAEQLGERAFTHRRALSRHCGAPPSPGRGTSPPPRWSGRTSAPTRL